jgi:hypothetical protein
MANLNETELRQWVVTQTRYLDPPTAWQSDPAAALVRFHTRLESDRPRARRWRALAWPIAAMLAVAVSLMLPASRVVAQQLWQLLTVRRVSFIRVNPWPDGVPSPDVKLIGTPIPPIPARDTTDVTWRVHFAPRLPRPGVLSDAPRFSTTLGLSAGTVVNATDLELALRKAGVTDQVVPSAWNGAHLALHTSAIVIAEWPDVVLAQSLPLTLTAPPGFDFSTFSAIILRVLGVGPDEALRLAQRVGTAPPWLVPVTKDFDLRANIEEVQLNSGPGTLLQQTADDGTVKRTSLFWNVPDRVYLLTGTISRELTIAAANAVQ